MLIRGSREAVSPIESTVVAVIGRAHSPVD